uniref:DUF4239 domain-containing protein n=1 Tax=Desulfovibrio sp. U5L TaxID=596152 RepID=I2Q2G0_9BACT
MNPYVQVFGAIGAVSLVLTCGLSLLRRRTCRQGENGWDLNTSVFSLFASLYAFFLGFCVVTLWNAFGVAKTIAAEEANALQTASYLSRAFNQSGGFRQALAAYAAEVVRQEWPAMDVEDAMSGQAQLRFDQIWDAYRVLMPEDKADNTLYANLGTVLENASRQRNARALLLRGNVSPPVWVIIVFGFGGVCLGLFCANPCADKGQAIMSFMVLFTTLSCIYFIFDISSPFSGTLNVPPTAFVNVLERMGQLTPSLSAATTPAG